MKILEFFTWFLALFSSPEHNDRSVGNILEVAKSLGATTFLKYVERCEWVQHELQSGVDYTALIPTNDALDDLSKIITDAFLHDNVLEWYLRYHIGLTTIRTGDVIDNLLLPSAFKPSQTTNYPVQQIRFNKYIIRNGELERTAHGKGGESVEVTSHEVLTVSGAKIIKADVPASNGVVHLIDKVMYPIPYGSNIPEFIANAPDLSTLTYLLKNSSILPELATDPSIPFTLFAPTDTAFNRLTPEQKKKLEDKKTLSRVLTYHVVKDALYHAGMYDFQRVTALSGDSILVLQGIGGTSVGGKMITYFDVTVTNGVIFKLAEVMFPPGV